MSDDTPVAVIATRRAMKELVDGTIRVQIDIDPQYRNAFLKDFSDIDIPVGLVRLNLPNGQTPAPPKDPHEPEQKPYGKAASELYRLGFFLNPKVLEAIGTDAGFLDWIRTMPCCSPESSAHAGDVVAAHVRRIADGAGTGIKPPYSAIPLCNHHHQIQHQHGESALGGKDWCDKQRVKYVVEWASIGLATHLTEGKSDSMGAVHPSNLRAWAELHDLTHALPIVYRY